MSTSTTSRIYRFLRGLLKEKPSVSSDERIQKYLQSGQKPWTLGYVEYKADYIRTVLQSDDLKTRFLTGLDLPQSYGYRLDERVVEYPWVLARLRAGPRLTLDAGGTLEYDGLLALPILAGRTIIAYSLPPGNGTSYTSRLSRIHGDLRDTILRDQVFDEVVCISTLEHVGMDNTILYTRDSRYREAAVQDYLLVIREFGRLVIPGGQLLITVPYGKYQNFGWLQQFDERMIRDVADAFQGSLLSEAYYQYHPDGWHIADAESCRNSTYFDVHTSNGEFDTDYAAAARAVACLELVKDP